MDINRKAAVIGQARRVIAAPLSTIWSLHTNITAWPTWNPTIASAQLDTLLTIGAVFHWSAAGLEVTSTVSELISHERMAWSGSAHGIATVHVWRFRPARGGVQVQTEGSWDSAAARREPQRMQNALDQLLRDWLEQLKRTAEAS